MNTHITQRIDLFGLLATACLMTSMWLVDLPVFFSTTSRQIMHSSCVQKCIHQLQNGYSSWCAFHFEMFSELLLSKLNWICFSVEPYNLYSLIYAVNHLEWRLLLCNVVYYAYLCCEWPSLVITLMLQGKQWTVTKAQRCFHIVNLCAPVLATNVWYLGGSHMAKNFQPVL